MRELKAFLPISQGLKIFTSKENCVIFLLNNGQLFIVAAGFIFIKTERLSKSRNIFSIISCGNQTDGRLTRNFCRGFSSADSLEVQVLI